MGDKRKMNEEELFCKLFPEYAVNGKPLSPYFDLFESGCEQSEKHITELEKENKTMRSEIGIAKGYIERIEKENAELKSERGCETCTKFDEVKLTKAKELLAKWVELFKPKGGNIPPTPIQVKTEQFLSEVEK